MTPPLCAGAERAFQADPRPGGEPVAMICLDYPSAANTLAAIGAGARQATENSATIAYVGEPDRKSVDFARPILETAGIGSVAGSDGAAAMRRVLEAVRESGGEDLRSAVREKLEGPG